MAPPKRKRKPTRITTNKRPKYTLPDTDSSSSSSSSAEEDSAPDSQEEWEAVRIVKQRGKGFALQYLIEWKDIDPATGEPWAPTWERASNAGPTLRASWRAELARRAQEKKEVATAARRSTQQRSAREESPAQATQTRGTRHSRVVESPAPSESANAADSPTETRQSPAAIASSTTIDFEAPIPDWTSLQVNIDVRGDSFNRGEYEPFSEIAESQSSLEKSAAEGTTLESSQLFASQLAFLASGIVRDTQSSAGDVSYIPVTQEELESSLHSDLSDECSEDHIVGYSGLLDTDEAPKPGARPHSPATSIAETVADTTQDFHSQRQLDSQQERSGISDTLESHSPATSGNTDRTDNCHNSGSSHQTEADLTQSQDSAGPLQAESPVLFVENTTQFDHEASIPEREQLPQERNEVDSSTQEGPEATSHTRLPASVQGSELLAVADTPHISQLSSTVRENTIQEAQSSLLHRSDYVYASAEYENEVSLTDCSVWEENAQFPFFSQRPACFDPSATRPTQRALTEPPRTCETRGSPNTRLSEGPRPESQPGGTLGESEESTNIDEITQSLQQEELRALFENSPTPQLSHTQADHRGLQSAASGSRQYTLDAAEAAAISQHPPSSEQSSGSCEHAAQLGPSSTWHPNTQDDSIESVRETVELDSADAPRSKHSSPCSRHDSSQETPERELGSVQQSSSPIPHPPSHSLKTLDSNVPPRPASPLVTSSLSKMAESNTETPSAIARKRLEELMGPDRREKRRSRMSQSSVAASTSSTAANEAASHSNNALVLPSINISAEGTRSPSTVPDRSPAPPSNAPLGTVPAASSLRSVAFANKVTEPLMIDSLLPKPKTVDKSSAEKNEDLVTAAAAAAAQSVPAGPSSPAAHDDIGNLHDVDATHDVDDMDDYDEDYDDPYDDELKLDDEEYIVPLYIEGRQRDTYTEYIKQKTDLFNEVYVHGQASIEELDKVDRALTHLKAIETHPDLTYAEAESATGSGLHSLADVQHGAQFGIDNSVKFKFLGHLFKHIRDKSMHVVLLLDQDNDALFNIVKTFLTAGRYNFKMPTKGLQSTESPDSSMITVFPKTVFPVIQAVHLIICLDGVQNAAQARQRKAAAAGKIIPVFHMVIPQTVGHIERYMLPTTDRQTCIETILAGLAKAQDGNQVGNAIDIDTPSAEQAAQMVTSWLCPDEGQESTEWPLPSIGSAKSLIEWEATQQSIGSAASSPTPERTKRPLDEDDFDPAKRMRYTPQPRVVLGSNAVHEPEVTRISDSMPGTAISENARLAASLDKVSTALVQERKERREEAVMWDRQQTEHENRQEQYRKLFNEKAVVDRELTAMTINRDQLRSKMDAQLAEVRGIREELEALRALNLTSPDEKNVEITRLRKELEAANLELEKVRKSAKTQDETMDFLKEQYRKAQVVAGQAQSEVETLTSTNAKLSQQASGEAAKLKQMHLDRSAKNLMQQNKALQGENAVLKARLKVIEEELARAKNNSGRSAYGTRGQSTTPQPKTRSRAASPTGGARAPRGGGRISNLVAEGM